MIKNNEKYILTEDEVLELRYMERFNATKHVFHEELHWCVDGGMVDPLYLNCMYEGLDETITYTIDELLSNHVTKEMMDSIKVLEDAKEWFSGMSHYNLVSKQLYEQYKNGVIIINDPKGELFTNAQELPANEQLKGFMRNNLVVIFFKKDGGVYYYKDEDGTYYYGYKEDELSLENVMDKEFMKVEIPLNLTKNHAFLMNGHLVEIDTDSLQIMQLLNMGKEINSILGFDHCDQCADENCTTCHLIYQSGLIKEWDSYKLLRECSPAKENPWVFVAKLNEIKRGSE